MSQSNYDITGQELSKEVTTLKYTDLSFWLIWVAIALVYIFIRINVASIPLDRDEGMFGYMGQLILDGGIPYLDAFDHKPPVVFYLNALALLFFPPTPLGIHVFLHIYNFLTLIALYYLVKAYSRSAVAGLWAAFIFAVFSSSPGIQGYGASTEMFLLLPLTLSLLFAVLTVSKKSLCFPILSGVFGALTFWTKQTAALPMVFIISYLIFAQIKSTQSNRFDVVKPLRSLALWGFGFLAISLLIGGYFTYHNAFERFIYCNFTYNFVYSKGIKFTAILPKYRLVLKEIAKGNFLPILIGVSVSVAYLFTSNKNSWFVLGFLFFSLLATIPGYAYWHYFAQIAPAVAIAAGLGITLLIHRLRDRSLRVMASLLFAAAIVLIPLFVHSGYYVKKSPGEISRHYFGQNPFPESIELAEFLASRTGRSDSIFIFGSEPQLLLYSQRRSATSFPYVYPLMSVYPGHKELQQEAWEEISAAKPKYIITVELPTSLAWDGKAGLWLVMKTRQMINQYYFLEAVMTIESPKGRLILVSEMDDPNKVINNNPVRIYILRSRQL